jgi:hypothetical protein
MRPCLRFGFRSVSGIACLCLITSRAPAQTVQLPTFSSTSVGTTVMVPDNGAAFLGGINRASTGRNEFGVPGLAIPGFQSRGIGQDMSATNIWATATIHDFDAMDQAILSGAPTDGFASNRAPQWPAALDLPAAPRVAAGLRSDPVNLAGKWQAEPSPAPVVSNVAVEEADRAARRAVRSTEADTYFARGQQAETDGKPAVAKIYYQMAARRATDDLKQQVLARLDAISSHATAVAKSVP